MQKVIGLIGGMSWESSSCGAILKITKEMDKITTANTLR
jgi:aspartate/glutamate racemase